VEALPLCDGGEDGERVVVFTAEQRSDRSDRGVERPDVAAGAAGVVDPFADGGCQFPAFPDQFAVPVDDDRGVVHRPRGVGFTLGDAGDDRHARLGRRLPVAVDLRAGNRDAVLEQLAVELLQRVVDEPLPDRVSGDVCFREYEQVQTLLAGLLDEPEVLLDGGPGVHVDLGDLCRPDLDCACHTLTRAASRLGVLATARPRRIGSLR
jgi:hypothetical protein